MRATFHRATFLQSAPNLDSLKHSQGVEFTFVGRSNSGKSSVINTLCQQQMLALSSSKPGKTRLINLFALDPSRQIRFTDLPGYGYARISRYRQNFWGQVITAYITERKSLKGIVVVMDIRHPFTDLDAAMINLANDTSCALHILLNKSDKISKNQCVQTLAKCRSKLKKMAPNASLSCFSALKSQGIPEIKAVLETWIQTKEQARYRRINSG